MLVVALTGGIGSGKSTVAQNFAELGALVIDADQLARMAIERGTDGFARVQALFAQAVADLELDDILIYEIPLLVETGAAEKFDYVVTVESDIELRKARLLKKGLYISQIEKRMASQASEEARTAIADAVIRNDGDEDSLLRQVENLWESVLLPQSLG